MIEKSFKKPAQLADKIIEEGLEISHPALLSAPIRKYGSVSLICELQKWLTQQDKWDMESMAKKFNAF